MLYVPVVDRNQQPLMPTTANRAASWIKSGKATPFWKRGVFCVRLNVEPSARNYQEVAVGVDPGSKKEGFTVGSKKRTFLNLEAEAVQHVKKRVETRRSLRRNRRNRKTPCRKNRQNRSRGGIPPSTKARWGWKLRIINWLRKLYPITVFVVEDIKARSKKFQRKWNSSFSPLEVGKQWFYGELEKLGRLRRIQGYQTATLRNRLGLKKSRASSFYAHCVDSWVLVRGVLGGRRRPENLRVLKLFPFKFFRRQLHLQVPAAGGKRRELGGTRSLGFKRGSLVRHPDWGLSYVGGSSKRKVSLHSLETGERLTQNVVVGETKFLSFCSWRFHEIGELHV